MPRLSRKGRSIVSLLHCRLFCSCLGCQQSIRLHGRYERQSAAVGKIQASLWHLGRARTRQVNKGGKSSQAVSKRVKKQCQCAARQVPLAFTFPFGIFPRRGAPCSFFFQPLYFPQLCHFRTPALLSNIYFILNTKKNGTFCI